MLMFGRCLTMEQTEKTPDCKKKTVYKYCFVPDCKNTTFSQPEKLFLNVPTGDIRKEWLKQVGRDTNSISLTSHLYCCEDHFHLEEDVENYIRIKLDPSTKIRLKKEALPRFFNWQQDRKRSLTSTCGPKNEVWIKDEVDLGIDLFDEARENVGGTDTEEDVGISGLDVPDWKVAVEDTKGPEDLSIRRLDKPSEEDGELLKEIKQEINLLETENCTIVKQEEAVYIKNEVDLGIDLFIDEAREVDFYIKEEVDSSIGEPVEAGEEAVGGAPERQLSCHYCGSSVNTRKLLKKHIHRVHKPGAHRYHCSQCSYSSLTKYGLKNHMVRHTGERPFPCEYCDYRAGHSATLKLHVMAKHTGEKPHKCDFCDYSTAQASTLRSHMTRHSEDRPYKCEYCSYRAKQLGYVRQHQKRHEMKHYSCTQCSYQAYSNANLKLHVRSVHAPKDTPSFKCSNCEFSSRNLLSVKFHFRVQHLGKRPIKCEYCDYETPHKSAYKVHVMRKHTKEKPFECAYCGYKCVQKISIKNHIYYRHKTNEKPFKCEYCDLSFVTTAKLASHMRTFHKSEKPYECTFCSYSSYAKRIFKNHVKQRHPKGTLVPVEVR